MSSGRMAKIHLEIYEASPSDKLSPKKSIHFPKKGFAGRGIVVTQLLNWLLNNNFTFPGKLIVHGLSYDVKRFGRGKGIEVINLGNNVYVNRKDYSNGQEVKK